MYTTIQGELIEGEIVNRHEHTMVVLAKDGRTYLCRLVGKSEPIKTSSLFDRHLDVNERRSRKAFACRLVHPDGKVEEFTSYMHAANVFGLKRQTIAKYVASGRVIGRGTFKGCRFEKGGG